MTTLYDFTVKTIDGAALPLAQLKGKALLIVNTASECGYTPQYEGLQKLYEAYRERGLEVLAFPCNDFGEQEPGSEADIKAFCGLRYKTTFPLFAKVVVKGADAEPLYRHLQGLPNNGGEVKWNFHKFLVDRQGEVVAHFDSRAAPLSTRVQQAVEAALS